MAGTPNLTKPAVGDDVRKLWQHVARLVDVVEEQRRRIVDLESQIGKRPLLDKVVYVKCCSETEGELYLPVTVRGKIYVNKGTGTATPAIEATAPIPDGALLLD